MNEKIDSDLNSSKTSVRKLQKIYRKKQFWNHFESNGFSCSIEDNETFKLTKKWFNLENSQNFT